MRLSSLWGPAPCLGSLLNIAAALPSWPLSDILYCLSGLCAWSLLPAEVQQQVYARLSAHDLALCARTSREFAAHVAERRSTVRTLILPPGMPQITGNQAYHNRNHAEMPQYVHACLGSSAGRGCAALSFPACRLAMAQVTINFLLPRRVISVGVLGPVVAYMPCALFASRAPVAGQARGRRPRCAGLWPRTLQRRRYHCGSAAGSCATRPSSRQCGGRWRPGRPRGGLACQFRLWTPRTAASCRMRTS